MTVLLITLIAGGLSLALSLALPLAVRPLLVKLGIMDVPNARSSHDRPVLRGLGLAVLLAMIIAAGVAVALFWSDGYLAWQQLAIVAVGFTASGALGLREDLRGLSVPARSAFLIAIALAASITLLFAVEAGGGVTLQWAAGIVVSPIPLWGAAILVIYAVLFLSSFINVANFMDGLNGISGFHGVIAGVTFAAAGYACDLPWLLVAGAILAAAFGGFLPWNLTRPGAFLGDVGSYLLGGAVALTSFAALISGVPFLATIGPMVIYFGDVGVTLVRRVRRGDKWYEPHKEHAYQRIQQLGYTHVQASLIAAGCSLLTSVLGFVAIYTSLYGTIALLIGGLAVLVFYIQLPRLLPARVRN